MSSRLSTGLNIAYRLLAYRDRSIFEIKSALIKKEFEVELIKEVIDNLVKVGYLNDEKFAFNFGSSIARRRRVGQNYVLQHLLKKGISKELASQAVEKIFENESKTESEIEKWVEKKKSSYKKVTDTFKLKKKIYDFLYRKGFNSHDIMQVLGRWNQWQ